MCSLTIIEVFQVKVTDFNKIFNGGSIIKSLLDWKFYWKLPTLLCIIFTGLFKTFYLSFNGQVIPHCHIATLIFSLSKGYNSANVYHKPSVCRSNIKCSYFSICLHKAFIFTRISSCGPTQSVAL